MEPSIRASYLPAPLTEDPEGPAPPGHQHVQLDLLQIRGCRPVCPAGGLSMCSVFHHSVFMKKSCRITSITVSFLSVWWLHMVLISHENSDSQLLRKPQEVWCHGLCVLEGLRWLELMWLCPLYCFPFISSCSFLYFPYSPV